MQSSNAEMSLNQQVLAGPILRRTEPGRIVLWLASQQALDFRLQLTPENGDPETASPATHHPVRVGERCFIHLLDFHCSNALPTDVFISWDLQWQIRNEPDDTWHSITDWAPDLLKPDSRLPRFSIRSRVDSLLHGSCRKPHHASEDGLVAAEHWLRKNANQAEQMPAALLLSGDQVYADDVAGPMLTAIHQLIDVLGLYDEQLEGALVSDSQSLYNSEFNYYRRAELLPESDNSDSVQKRVFEGARKPIFTSANADNPLVTLSEVIALYLLVWSPVPWTLIKPGKPPELSQAHQQRYAAERNHLQAFVAGLPAVRRLLTQLPVLMIFDDHDITEDWNLTADWEKTAYGHPFSRRIIGNALIAYLLCQGWGNQPDNFKDETLQAVQIWSDSQSDDDQKKLIDHLLSFNHWHFSLDSSPRIVVLDTRTRRWRSESNLRKPSGLMDWEALTELQDELLNHEAVILVSPAPIFGVKLIEVVQKIFTWLGKPLMVDAENWMAHPGTANVILNIFRHTRTPQHFVILSGDVHYSFVYGIRLRSSSSSPHLWQITSSGIKNAFPQRLLDTLDRLNRWLYSPRSPLNWFTRRRQLEVMPYRHQAASRGERLLNRAGVGYVRFDEHGKPIHVEQISTAGNVCFKMERTSH